MSRAGRRLFCYLALLAALGVGLALHDQPRPAVHHDELTPVGTLPAVPAAHAGFDDGLDLPRFVPPAPIVTDPTSTVAPRSTSTIAVPQAWHTMSTAYCLHGVTASGAHTAPGTVAVSYDNFPRLRGTSWRVTAGPAEVLGRTFTVADTGSRAEFDMWFGDRADCTGWALNSYGRRPITVVPA